MITLIMILTTISILWDLVKLGGKAALWVLKWCIIISAFIGLIIPVFIGIFFMMCMVSFIAWALDIITAAVMKTEPKLDRSPFDFRKNWDKLLTGINRRAAKQAHKQASRNNDIYVVEGKDLAKATRVKPENQPISLDEIILCDLIFDD